MDPALEMSDFTVVIPLRAEGDEHRAAAARHVTHWLDSTLGVSVEVAMDERADQPWSKGEMVDIAVQASDTPGLIIHDADVLVHPRQLQQAMTAVCSGFAWAMPHAWVNRLTRRATQQVYSGPSFGTVGQRVPSRYGRRHLAPAGGGIVVCTRDAYDQVGGIDPRFVGWGGEDISFARALDTLAGPGWRGSAEMWHLWHPEQPMPNGPRRGSMNSEALAGLYAQAEGNEDAMRALIGLPA